MIIVSRYINDKMNHLSTQLKVDHDDGDLRAWNDKDDEY